MNEPNVFIGLGYVQDLHPPGFKNDYYKEMIGMHYSTLAHAKAVKIYKEELGLTGLIGASVAYGPSYPLSDSAEDKEACENALNVGA
jgi:beta-glucosidase